MNKRIVLIMLCFSFLIVTVYTDAKISLAVTNERDNNSLVNAFTKINKPEGVTVIDLVGDIHCSKKLSDRLKADNPTLFVALGDLCYKRDLKNFSATFNDLKIINKLACVIGNHDSLENGNLRILNQALKYCGDHWYRKVANNSTLLIGLNTNGNISLQTYWGRTLVSNVTFMNGVNNVMLLAHKPAHTPPGSDHQAENSTIKMFSSIVSIIPKGVKVLEIAAHNHLMAESSNGDWFISGAGGRKLYNYTSHPDWSFINNKDHGYLQIKINNTDGGLLSNNFYGSDGRLLH
jgi:hypothetical protein